MQTIAEQIAAEFKSFADASNVADRLAVSKDQDWENETTISTFADGSKLSQCYPFSTVV